MFREQVSVHRRADHTQKHVVISVLGRGHSGRQHLRHRGEHLPVQYPLDVYCCARRPGKAGYRVGQGERRAPCHIVCGPGRAARCVGSRISGSQVQDRLGDIERSRGKQDELSGRVEHRQPSCRYPLGSGDCHRALQAVDVVGVIVGVCPPAGIVGTVHVGIDTVSQVYRVSCRVMGSQP